MQKIHFAFGWLFLFSAAYLNAQKTAPVVKEQENSILQGKVTDENDEPLFGAVIILLQDGAIVKGMVADMDGHYKLENIPEGTYDLKVTYLGFEDKIIEDLEINPLKGGYYTHAIELIVMLEVPKCPCVQEIEVIVPNNSENMHSGWQAERLLEQNMGF